MRLFRILPVAFCIALVACGSRAPKFTVESPDAASSAPASFAPAASSAAPATPNVSYTGILEPAGISIYMQGTHRLQLGDGRFLLLESSGVTLTEAVGKRVEVFGSVRPTVEAGGIIMAVDRLTVMEEPAASSIAASLASHSATSASALQSSKVSSTTPSNIPTSSHRSSTPSATSAAASSAAAESATSIALSPEMAERVSVMAKEDLSPSRWTQQYCSSHIGFCIPIHKNWWFKSFGTTASALWHVEISNAPIDALGSAPLIVNVRSGTVESRKAVDGQVRVQGDTVVGFKSWTENRYFEIVAPRDLEGAVQYITKNLTAYEG